MQNGDTKSECTASISPWGSPRGPSVSDARMSDDKTQAERFKEAARDLGADDDEDRAGLPGAAAPA